MQMHKILEIQKAAFLKHGSLKLGERKQILSKLLDILLVNKAEICAALKSDFSARDEVLSEFSDLNPAVQSLKFAIKNIDKWVKTKSVPTTPPLLGFIGAGAQIQFQAKGVIGVLSPWNFPINLTFAPLAGIIAAGNRAMIKPSELTPITSQLIEKLINENFEPDILRVINGGVEIATEFSKLKFDHIMFTGATSIGKKIMAAASENLVPVTLELGGKSPVIISKTANLSQSATRIIAGKLMNAGQVCLAPDYVVIDKEMLPSFVSELKNAIAAQFPTILKNPEYTAIINERHFSRLQSYIDEAKANNCEIIEINPANEDKSHTNERKLLPTLIINPPSHLKIMNDEIFGPILPIMTIDGLDGKIDFINERPRPLALYYFGNDKDEKTRVQNQTISGAITFNDVIFHIAMEHLPFGGVGDSGIGAYHGYRGFLEFSHQKAIYSQLPKDNFLLKAFRTPYGKIMRKYLDFEMRK